MRRSASRPDEVELPLRRSQDGPPSLFPLDQVERKWDRDWAGMPAYEMGDITPFHQIIVSFRSREDMDRFAALLGPDNIVGGRTGSSKITERTESITFGGREDDYVAPKDVVWETVGDYAPRYPVYVPSVGRWESPQTHRSLRRLGVPHRVVVEPAQFDNYAEAIGERFLLVLPEDYSTRNTGSVPARNWIWEHSLEAGHSRHWVIDDNVNGFQRLHRNRRMWVSGPSIFCAAEDFTDRYDNVAFSGFNYVSLLNARSDPPFYLNTRVYSMILVNNSLEYRWRGRYNEDTDICLRALKDGWCTVLFNAFLGNKATTLTMRGGNTDTVYATGDRRLEFARSLERQHPDLVKVVWRYNRWHHEVDYSRFRRNRLRPRAGSCPRAPDPEYGMRLVPAARV